MENRNNNPIAEEIIHNNPTGYGLFAGIGDNFNSAAQAICELADDAISNLRANSDDPDLSMTIVVSFENLGDAVKISVVDGGTGITNLDSALTIACRDGAQTPLNEHGFGLKHALASCDSSPSQQWSIRTRTKKDAAANQYREVTAPYSMGTSEEDQPMKVFFYPGAGGLPYPTGTAVTVRCPMAKFQTVKPDRKAAQSDFHCHCCSTSNKNIFYCVNCLRLMGCCFLCLGMREAAFPREAPPLRAPLCCGPPVPCGPLSKGLSCAPWAPGLRFPSARPGACPGLKRGSGWRPGAFPWPGRRAALSA